ncbi:4-hydroxy-tetrahydrodipicolinate reductase [Halosegnis rubeus]|jgi:4-hydroxy-tetrahydrodipicolinate reductase|uniref:4-hydroxy-tetrahydrodipicolinate reductase n=1 Tax=Halosegnis rubeus TaxID=2212850 RepID=A0A5N5ULD2_9EURY|nr:4-hydroxy-tetrahydrodipicolinate reductase [Halosegnis rubeus]KAB7513362.1 4-hydroxy-tetrahydrodipicolinate reductase [Halosegnis rubeus]KAB7517345.1 4-hydroxy-tetrahydrodipicolinate reductase [Halosegnis rubeus]KAB7518422.1 4-hydroxy-tetrahydrodipicolinate reductase [Halosegnis rubeus]
MKVAVAGATGRTGSESVAELRDRDHDVLALSRDPTGGQRDIGDLATVLTETDPDALIDFTVPEATVEHAAVAAETAVPLVVGTTGFDDDGLAALADAAREIPVLRASNFAKGVHALRDIVQAGVEALPEYDIELTETHHNGKRDAPSGTALTLLDDIDDARGTTLDRTHGREGEHERAPAEVGVHVRRAGNVRGEHEVLLAGNDEVVTLTHRAESRRVFAAGAVDAAEALAGRPAGEYDFPDVL